MQAQCFRRAGGSVRVLVGALLAVLVAAGSAVGQDESTGTPAEAPAARFEPRYIDTESYRDSQVLLHDWPALTELIRWSGPLSEAIAVEDATLPAELLTELRERVATLAAAETPSFLAARRDSVAGILETVEARLDQADVMLAASLPAQIADPTGEERPNVADQDRTYATGPTAVTVPAGIGVGVADSLPGAEIAGGPALTYVDLVAQALDELDGLVHLVRKSGQPSPGRGGAGPSSPPGTATPRPAP